MVALRSAADADRLLSVIAATGGDIRVVLAPIINRVGPPEMVARTTRYNELLRAIAERRIAAGDPLVVVDMEHALRYTAAGGNGALGDMYDLLHPNDAGYGKRAAETNVFYRLEEPSPPFADALGGPATGCVNCPAPGDGRVGRALRFDGLDDGLAVAGDGRFDWGERDAFAVEFWLQRPGGCGGATFDHNEVVAGQFDPASGMAWWVGVSCQHGGRARFVLRDSDGGDDLADVVAQTALTGGAWHHVVAVNDPTLLDVRLYIDGVLEGVAPAYFSSGFASAAALDIGRLNLLGGFHLAGTLDEVALYDRALTEDEIRHHFATAGQGQPYCAPE